jgi:hypothetical protein
MNTEHKLTREAIHNKITSQIDTIVAKIATLKARAESNQANTQLKTIAELTAARLVIDRKLRELKTAGDAKWQQAKSDIEAEVKDLEQSIHAVESQLKSSASTA